MKSVADDPVSAEMSIELMVVVGSAVSWLARMDAWVAAFPAVSDTSAVTVISPSEMLAQFSSSHIVTDHVPSPAIVPVSETPPYPTVTVCPDAPEETPVIVNEAFSSLLTYPSVATVCTLIVGATSSNVTELPPVRAVTCTPEFVAVSAKSSVNATVPAVSPACIV